MSDLSGDPTRGGRGPRGPGRSRAYVQAQRHSARVRFFKRVIPIGAVAAIALVAAVALFNPFGRAGGLSLGPVSLNGTKITMEAPKLTGYRKDSQAYEVTATAAMQDVRKPNVIELKDMKARLVLDDAGNAAHLEALFGVLDTQKEQLQISENVRVRTDDGQRAELKSASIDFKAGTVSSREPVTLTMTGGVIEADSLDITENGKLIVFTGRVRAVFQDASPSAEKANPDMPAIPPTAGRPAAERARTSQAAPLSLRP